MRTVASIGATAAYGATLPFATELAKVGNPPRADPQHGYQASDLIHSHQLHGKAAMAGLLEGKSALITGADRIFYTR